MFNWLDTSFAVNLNMGSHIGGAMSMGYRIIHSRSRNKKLNTKSKTQSELVGTSEYVPFNIWIVTFYEAQGYEITKNVLFQDNESAIKMENN